ncbi:MAG: hypothetical protein QMD22_00755 [archaeon]|nr:hypothetical protein [archaeon]
MHLKTLKLTLKSDRPVEEDAAKLRGFFATRFTEYALLHQHIDVDNSSNQNRKFFKRVKDILVKKE